MSLTDRARENSDEALDKIKDVAETVGISVAVVASETWDKAKDLADSIGHRITDLAEDVKDKVSGHDGDEEPAKDPA